MQVEKLKPLSGARLSRMSRDEIAEYMAFLKALLSDRKITPEEFEALRAPVKANAIRRLGVLS